MHSLKSPGEKINKENKTKQDESVYSVRRMTEWAACGLKPWERRAVNVLTTKFERAESSVS